METATYEPKRALQAAKALGDDLTEEDVTFLGLIEAQDESDRDGPFEVYYTKDPTFVGKPVVLAAGAHHSVSWYSDGNFPKKDFIGDGADYAAVRWGIVNARSRGLEYNLDIGNVSKLAEEVDDDLDVNIEVAFEASEGHANNNSKETTKMAATKGSTATAVKAETKPKSQKSGNFKDVSVQNSVDETIHVPEGMSLAEAREWLQQIEENEEQTIQWSSEIDAYPLDGAMALRRVLDRRYGSAVKAGATRQGFFGEEEIPPFMVAVEVGVGKTDYVPWGYFIVPSMPGQKITTQVTVKGDQLYFVMGGEIKRKNKALMDAIAEDVRREVQENSIYRGQAIRVAFPEMFDNPSDFAPNFIQPASADDSLILPRTTEEQVEVNIFTPVERTTACQKAGIPLKRGVLLAGRYGVGKTLTASILARKCVENGWTFIYLKTVEDLAKATLFAKRYQPAVIFAEDVDAVVSGGRNTDVNAILNTLDGVDTKNTKIMTVLTTNFLEKIDQALLRPGRLDAVVVMEPPDAEAALRLVRYYSRGLLDHEDDSNLQEACELLKGQIPAVIRETVERSKLASIRRAVNGFSRVTANDLLVSARGMLSHLRLLEERRPDDRQPNERAVDRAAAWKILENPNATKVERETALAIVNRNAPYLFS